MEIYCLVMSGASLTEELRSTLLRTALAMYSTNQEHQQLHGNDFEGRVTTEYKRGMVGVFSGTVFSAEIESDQGRTKVTYIVRTHDLADLDRASWTSDPDEVFTNLFPLGHQPMTSGQMN